MLPVYITVGSRRRVLGQVDPAEPGELPELLRHVADYYDDNPDDCEELCRPFPPADDLPPYLATPFTAGHIGHGMSFGGL